MSVAADQFYMIGIQFADVGNAEEKADFNSFLSTTCTPGQIGDGSDPTWGNAPMIQVLNADGASYTFYYYISDADDGTMRYDLTGWTDSLGNLVTGTQVGVGTAFWIKSATAGTLRTLSKPNCDS